MMAWPGRLALSSAASRQLLVCRGNRRPPPTSAALAACRSCLPHRGPRYARIVPGTLRPADRHRFEPPRRRVTRRDNETRRLL